LESLSREQLIQLVQKQLANQNEAHKQLEAVKKEAEESAKQQATKIDELNNAFLASQQKVEQLTAEMANHYVEHQKHLDNVKQAEVYFDFLGILLTRQTWLIFYQEFAQRIVQLEQEKAEVQTELGQKLAEIEEIHKEMEKRAEEVAEKAKEIDELLMQLKESRFLN
jgi:peptidoglycan hydrolase CwlO-like protein